ncbi:MAG: LytTR family DNA-binding domain-containing protein [Lachnospiraceae bacterium]|nr:LytTR family DNA-binding domain-containing protein [Lachnospiraceae bacterium]
MLSIAVCDDEILDCCNMAKDINDVLEEIGIPFIVRQFSSGRDLLNAMENFDVIFLDIMMCGMDGMKTAQLLREKAFDKILIFISASRDYVFEAYDVEAFQYLVKPVVHHKLKSVLQRVVKKLENHSQEFMLINQDRTRKKLLLREIYYFEIRGRIISVHGVEGIFDYYEQIGTLEKELQGKGFFRCHKSFLVNLKYVDNYNRQEIILDTGEKIAIAKRRYEAFCQEILEYMKRSGDSI